MEKIKEKAIWYNKDTDTYVVRFTFSGYKIARGFHTLQDAVNYRNTIYKERLKYKTLKDTNKLRELEDKEISKIVPYPYNVLEATRLSLEEINCEIIDNFDKFLNETLNERQEQCILLYYKDDKNLEQIGKILNVSRERIRQIIAKSLHRIEHHIRTYDSRKEAQELQKYRDKLIEILKEQGTITDEMKYEFGEIHITDTVRLGRLDIYELDLSIRAYNCLKRNGIKYIEELTELTFTDLLHIKNMGIRSAKEVREKLQGFGLELKGE